MDIKSPIGGWLVSVLTLKRLQDACKQSVDYEQEWPISTTKTTRWWFQKFFYFHPYLGKWSNLTNIFQVGCNHQPDKYAIQETPSFFARNWGKIETPSHSNNKHMQSHRIHVWYVYLHLPYKSTKCRWIYHTWILWASKLLKLSSFSRSCRVPFNVALLTWNLSGDSDALPEHFELYRGLQQVRGLQLPKKKGPWLFRVYVWDEILLPSYVVIIINYYKHPY